MTYKEQLDAITVAIGSSYYSTSYGLDHLVWAAAKAVGAVIYDQQRLMSKVAALPQPPDLDMWARMLTAELGKA